MSKGEAWKPRDRVIIASGVNDYDGVVNFRPARGFRRKFADDAAVEVNCFIRRMIRNSKAKKGN